MYRRWTTACVVIALIFGAWTALCQEADVMRLYVSVDGDDAATGAAEAPLATLEGARDRIRALREAGELAGPVEVLIRGGTYRLRETFVLEPQDSGTAEAPVTYAAYPGEEPVISGGRPVTGWQPAGGGLWQAHIASVERGTRYFRQLWVNGRRATRARIPNRGYLQLQGLVNPYNP
ncbi:MAG: hypothetical protein ACP5KN_19005, partial [Armatimonadota bacterium]